MNECEIEVKLDKLMAEDNFEGFLKELMKDEVFELVGSKLRNKPYLVWASYDYSAEYDFILTKLLVDAGMNLDIFWRDKRTFWEEEGMEYSALEASFYNNNFAKIDLLLRAGANPFLGNIKKWINEGEPFNTLLTKILERGKYEYPKFLSAKRVSDTIAEKFDIPVVSFEDYVSDNKIEIKILPIEEKYNFKKLKITIEEE